ncbi:MAG TPA: hypothetical protein VNL73_08500 [Verrucomicrobiae bacterium]|nr:hypothetical protein [Verrucomicrobiae bacterium]
MRMTAHPVQMAVGVSQAASVQKTNFLTRWIGRVIYFVSFSVLVYLFVDGASYYTLPYAQRPHHERYRTLRPAGSRGLAFGIAGSAMMVLMLVYSLRKRTQLLRRLGNLPHWLNFHIYLGIMGPLLILLHSSFKVQGLVAVSFWSMVVVAASGVFGRYLYRQIPRNIQGNQLNLQELEELNKSFVTRLNQEFGLSDTQISRFDSIGFLDANKNIGLLRAFSLALLDGWLRVTIHRRLRIEYAKSLGLPRRQLRQLVKLAEKKTQLRHRVILLGQMQKLFHYWHVVHKPFAVIMYIVMAVHIGVAVWTGYAWNF